MVPRQRTEGTEERGESTDDHNSGYDSRATGRLSALSKTERISDSTDAAPAPLAWIGAYIAVCIGLLAVVNPILTWWYGTPPDGTAHIALGLFFVLFSTGVIGFLAFRAHRRFQRIEKQLHERDYHVGRIIDTMANGIALVDLDGTIVDVNPALAEMLGVERSDLVGRALAPIRSSNGDQVMSTSAILEYARRNGQWSGELERRHAAGHSIPIHLTLAPLYDDGDQLTGYVGDYLDLRDVKTVQEHLDGLGTIIEQLASETDLELVGSKAVTAAVELTATDLGGVVLLDDEHGRLEHRWLHGFPDRIESPRPADDPDLVARTIERGQPRVVDELDSSPRRLQLYEHHEATALAAVPLTVRGVIRGALVVASHRGCHEFDDRHIPLLEAIARQIGVALHRHELLEDARRSEARFRNVVNSVPDIVYSASLPNYETEFVSPSVQRLLDMNPDEFLANPRLWRSLIHDDDLDDVDDVLDTVTEPGENYCVEYRLWNRDRTQFLWVEDRGRVHGGDDGGLARITGVVSNITARKEAEDRLAYLAFHDRLTGLPNRIGFLEHIDEFFEAPPHSPAVLLYCDLDQFHLVNDIHGHDCGNQLLVETARRLEQILPSNGVLGRIGADEFVAFIPVDPQHLSGDQPDDDDLESLLERRARDYALEMMALFREPFSIHDQPSYLSTTIGIGLALPDVDEGRTLLKNAHRALAHAKETGPANFAFYAGDLADRQQRRLSLQSQIHRGLDNDEFSLHYQPVVELESGAIVGAEALLRWTTPDGESISPGEFIPVAEESGLIIPLGDWVIHRVCRDLSRWIDEGLDLRVALNLSPRQFFHLDIVEQVQSAANNAGIAPGQLELELTESDMLVDPEETAQILTRLREAGFSVSIDDFGTGYSSLQRLNQLPVETLKIDRTFVSQLPARQRDASIVETIITLSDNFEMTALAEGIETRQQWELLVRMGCNFGQGYFFSRPVPADEFRNLCQGAPHWETRAASPA